MQNVGCSPGVTLLGLSLPAVTPNFCGFFFRQRFLHYSTFTMFFPLFLLVFCSFLEARFGSLVDVASVFVYGLWIVDIGPGFIAPSMYYLRFM